MGALGVGTQVGVLLPYSRKHESEADFLGLKYMALAGYDPSEAPKLWVRMAEASGGGQIELLSTHPDPLKRSQELEKQLPSVSQLYANSKKVPNKKIFRLMG